MPPLELRSSAKLALLISAAFPLSAGAAPAGRIDFAIGNVTAKSADGRHDRQSTPFGHEHHAAALAAPITFEGVEVRDGRRLVGELGRAELDRRDAEYRVRLERFAALLTRRAGKER